MPTVPSRWKEIGLTALMLSSACGVGLAAPTAAVSGIVRDTHGIAQMGAVVQVLSSGSLNVASAMTDLYGRYRIANLVPGRYEVRASAPLFVPASRGNLRLSTGARATVNLTLAMLSDPAAWLPAERRKPNEPDDDWIWTLRSAANRPILRVLGDGQVVLATPGGIEAAGTASIQARGSVLGGNGGFGDGGMRAMVALESPLADGSTMLLRTQLAAPGTLGTLPGNLPATEVDAGFERPAGLAGASRLVVSYESHPEMLTAGGITGFELVRLAGAQRMKLGDAVDVEAGGSVYAVHMAGDAIASQPFLRLTVHPGQVWAVRYNMATARDLQSFSDLNSVRAELPATARMDGLQRVAGGVHQELTLSRKLRGGVVQAAVYHDRIAYSAIAGIGKMDAADLLRGCGPSSVTADTATGSFQFLGTGYTANGMRVNLSEPLASGVWATLEYRDGAALAARNIAAVPLPEASAQMRAGTSQAASAAVEAHTPRAGTRLLAAYHWQPRRLLTPVGSYDVLDDQAFLSLYVRQALHWGDRMPPGLAATVDVTNLLAQGYQPFLSADGRTLFLAQSPRTLQAGLSFTF
jgi:hypothetical protein